MNILSSSPRKSSNSDIHVMNLWLTQFSIKDFLLNGSVSFYYIQLQDHNDKCVFNDDVLEILN